MGLKLFMTLKKTICRNILFSALLLIAGCGGKITPLDITQRDFEIANVIDGNTISITRVILVSNGKSKYHVRTIEYIGLNSLDKNEPFYKSAKECNIHLLRKGHVRVEFDQQILDSSNKKLLAYVYADGILVNAEMIKRGYARAEIIEPNTKYAKLFSQLEKEARENRRGIWSYEPDREITPDVIIPSEKGYVASRSGKSFHRPSCPIAQRIEESNKIYFESFKEAINSGMKPCKVCKPAEDKE
jgi:micrococcal nuclease